MRRFLLKLLLYFLPITIYGVITIGIPYYAGEFDSLRDVARKQVSSDPILYGRAYKDNFFSFKLISAKLRHANILVLGSSRVMQFRSFFFTSDEVSFYNAGGSIENIFQLRRFLRELQKDELPDILIVGLDQDWFHPTYAQIAFEAKATPIDFELSFDEKHMINTSRIVLGDWLTGDLNILKLIAREEPAYQEQALGVDAIRLGSGFRNDGSRQYGPIPPNPPSNEQRFEETIQRIKDGNRRFDYGDEFSQMSIDELKEFLDYCVEQGIVVIGFSPPYAPSVYAEMAATGKYTYIPKLTNALKAAFEEYGFAYFDFSDGLLPDTSDDNYLDGFHGSELVYLQLYRHMVESLPEVLGSYSDPALLREMFMRSHLNPYEVSH